MPTITPPRVPLEDLVAATHGIVTTPELHAAGYDDNAIQVLVRRRAIIRLRRGTFAVGHCAFGDDADRMAKLRCAGSGAALIGISAGRCWRLTERAERVTDIVVPSQRRRVPGARICIDRALPPDATVDVRGMPIVTPSWTILSLARRMEPGELARVLREASFRRRLDMRALHAISEAGNRPGVVVLRRAIDLRMIDSDGYASAFEASVDRYVRRRVEVRAVPNLAIDVDDDRLRVDLVWPTLRICLEIDGPLHDDPDVRREDERRTQVLEARRWLVFRIHWTEWEADRAAAAARVLEAVAERASSMRC